LSPVVLFSSSACPLPSSIWRSLPDSSQLLGQIEIQICRLHDSKPDRRMKNTATFMCVFEIQSIDSKIMVWRKRRTSEGEGSNLETLSGYIVRRTWKDRLLLHQQSLVRRNPPNSKFTQYWWKIWRKGRSRRTKTYRSTVGGGSIGGCRQNLRIVARVRKFKTSPNLSIPRVTLRDDRALWEVRKNQSS
jgi:hypothetical protein